MLVILPFSQNGKDSRGSLKWENGGANTIFEGVQNSSKAEL